MVRKPLDEWLVRRMGWKGEGLPTQDQLRAWQLARLRETVAHARRHSPFYGRHLSGTDPLTIGSMENFSRLPTMGGEHVRAACDQMLCVSQDAIERVVTLTSSGTSGPPKRIFHTAEDLEATTDFFALGMRNMTGEGETVFVLLDGERPGGVGQLLGNALARIGARTVCRALSDDVDECLEQLHSSGASCIVGPPAHVNLLACSWEARNLPADQVRSVLLCWDSIPEAVAARAQRAFGCRVFRHWGMIETGLGGAVECEPGAGMHLRETDVYLEIVDPLTGRLLPDGEMGEMIVSTPLRRGMPLIRYRTGDLGRILPGQCSCGSPLRLLDSLVERLAGSVDTGCGRLTMGALNEAVYGVEGLTDFVAVMDGRVLRIEVCGPESGNLPVRVRQALETVPVVGQALRENRMGVDVVVRPGLGPAAPGLAKRTIQIIVEK